jgi:thiamine pyrophosphate-dependent acetolactate synthase large subunit-like protein
MSRLGRFVGGLLHPAWWRWRYGSTFDDVVGDRRPGWRLGWDLARTICRIEMKRLKPRRILAALGVRVERRNSDFMLDVLKKLGMEYVGANSGTTVLALHESIVNYGGNVMPEFLTCLHEESAVALAHGYASARGRPMMVLLHGTIGLQHAARAIQGACVDRAPVFMIVGSGARGFRVHNARDMARMVRPDLKWDDEPRTLAEFADSAMRAFRIALTPPMGPVLLVVDQLLQELPFGEVHLDVPSLSVPVAPRGETAAVREAARLLVAAERPLIVAERVARTSACLDLLVDLAECVSAPVRSIGRVSFPNRHPLAGSGGPGYEPDLVLALEVDDPPALVSSAPWAPRVITVSATGLAQRGGMADDDGVEAAVEICADVEATLPSLIDECRTLMTADHRRTAAERAAHLGVVHQRERDGWLQAGRDGEGGQMSMRRVCAELWPFIESEDWSLVSSNGCAGDWPQRLWNFDKSHRSIFGADSVKLGCSTPAAVGAALANRKHGRVSIGLQPDTDLLSAPGALWTAAHHRVPLLTVMLDTSGHDRVAPALTDPDIGFAQLARSVGLHSEGPLGRPEELAPAFRRGIERVKQGEPVLIEIRTKTVAAR